MHARTSWLRLVFLFSTLLIATTAFAQGSIGGLVKDSTGAVLPGVTVEAASPVLIEKVRTTISDSSGRYQIVDLRPGSYTITFTLPGFNTVKHDGVIRGRIRQRGRGRRPARRRARGDGHRHRRDAGRGHAVDHAAARAQLRDGGCAAERAQLLRPRAHDSRHARRRQRRRRLPHPGRRPERHRPRQQERRSARDRQRRQHHDAAGRRQHRRPDARRRLGLRGDGGHQLALGRSADRRRAHQLRAQGRRQPLLELDVPHLREREPAGRQLLRRAPRRGPGHARTSW